MPTPDATTRPWPHWMLRYMMLDTEEAFWELVWSVGGSPPYGGVSYEEAEAIYHLIESFRGAGMARPEHYAAARALVKGNAERERVLELFHCYDQIVSNSDAYPKRVADEGLALARAVGDAGIIGLFTLYQAGALTREQKNAEAAALTLEALEPLLDAAAADEAYGNRAAQAAQNAIALTALAGDTARATKLLDDLGELLPAANQSQLRRYISAQSQRTV